MMNFTWLLLLTAMFFYPNDDQMRKYFRGPHKHHSCKFSSNVLSCFIKEDKNTTDEGKDGPGAQCDGNSSHDELKKY
jgi:hypothetical protein